MSRAELEPTLAMNEGSLSKRPSTSFADIAWLESETMSYHDGFKDLGAASAHFYRVHKWATFVRGDALRNGHEAGASNAGDRSEIRRYQLRLSPARNLAFGSLPGAKIGLTSSVRAS